MLVENLLKTDIVGRLQPYVDRGEISYSFIGDDWIRFHGTQATNSPWLQAKNHGANHCHLWHTIYFGVFGIIPKKCLNNCWKITACNRGMDGDVIRQLTMRDVIDIHDFQSEFDWPSKCGMDRRVYTPNIWGAFWYHDDLKMARKNFDKVKAGVPEGVDVQIKRSCTEFELRYGTTDKWDSTDWGWEEMESVLDNWIFMQEPPQAQTYLMKQNVRVRMLYWARQHGDFTFRDFTDGEDLVYQFNETKNEPIVPPVTYHEA